jgi:hypothetical protein
MGVNGIVAPMVDRMSRYPDEPDVEDAGSVDAAVALGSLVLLLVGLFGIVFSIHLFSAVGIFLFALFGFGSAVLSTFGWRGWRLVCFAPPLSLASVIIVGVLLDYLKIWAVGPVVFWLAAAYAVYVHLRTLVPITQDPSFRRRWDPRTWIFGYEGLALSRSHSALGTWHRLVRLEGTLVGIGVGLCLGSALATQHLDPGWGGLLSAISPAWYVGLLLIIGAIFVGQRLREGWLLGVPVVALQLMLTLTPAIVYGGPRYGWTGIHLGVTGYILLHGTSNPHIDIYQAWPGLFAGVAWLCKVAHFSSPVGVSRWWPSVIDFATLLVVFQLAKQVLRNSAQAWLAATVFLLGYTIADADYYSPQSACYLLAIATFALMFRHRDEEQRMPPAAWILLFTMSIADAITHQLSPYMVTVALVVLVVFRRSNTQWAPLITLAPAVAWALIYFDYTSQFVSWHAFLNIFKNSLTPGLAGGGPPPGSVANAVRLFEGGSALLVGLLALAAILRRRDALSACLALCAASAGALVAANSYGNEADFRVVLFALPWLAVLAGGLALRPLTRSTYLWPLAACALLVLYLGADLGLDFAYATRPGDLAALAKFELSAPVGSYLITIGESDGSPSDITGRFNEVNEVFTPNVVGAKLSAPLLPGASYTQFMGRIPTIIRRVNNPVIGSNTSYYVLFAQQPAAYLAAYNWATLAQYAAFEAVFAKSPSWHLVLKTPTAKLFELNASTPV